MNVHIRKRFMEAYAKELISKVDNPMTRSFLESTCYAIIHKTGITKMTEERLGDLAFKNDRVVAANFLYQIHYTYDSNFPIDCPFLSITKRGAIYKEILNSFTDLEKIIYDIS